jgi:GNAT superfamily N-acetyltransferase
MTPSSETFGATTPAGPKGLAGQSYGPMVFDTPETGVFDAIFNGLDHHCRPFMDPADLRLLVIPIWDDARAPAGGLWAATLYRWLHIQMVFIPGALQGRGIGSALIRMAEHEAHKRGCLGAYTETLSFQAAPFYEKLGYRRFGTLQASASRHHRVFLCKTWGDAQSDRGHHYPAIQ